MCLFRPAFFLTCAAASWGVATVLSKRAVEEIVPLVLLPLQLGVSVLALGIVTGLTQVGTGWTSTIRRFALLGVLNPGVAYALSLVGLLRITAGLSVLLWALEPVLILLLARVALGERLAAIRGVFVVAAVGGAALVVWQSRAAGDVLGIALTVAGVGACAVYTVACRKFLADDAVLPVVLVQQASALVFAVILYVASIPFTGVVPNAQVSGAAWASALMSGVLYYGLAFWLYLTGLRHVAASTAAVFLTLIPVFGIAAAHVLLGEQLTGRQGLGAAIVVTALAAMAVFGRKPLTAAPRDA